MKKASNFIVLDIGSSKIAGIASYLDQKGNITIVSQNLYCSKGIRSGVILDMNEAQTSILGAVYNLERDCGYNIKDVTISLSGYGTKSYYASSRIKVSNSQPITEQDIKKLIKIAINEFKIKDKEIIQYFPIDFILDNNMSVKNPIGMYASDIVCELHVITVASNILLNIMNCFAKCHIEINNILLAIYASAIGCLTQDEKELGTIIIDMGARSTTLGIFISGQLMYIDFIDIGGFHITSDIAKVFGLDINLAEKLKVLYGTAMPSIFHEDKIISLENDAVCFANNIGISITSKHLAEVIQPRLEEIFRMLKDKSNINILNNMLACRVVITGGGAMLRGIKELANTIFDKQVRIAKPETLEGFLEEDNPYVYSSCIGLLKDKVLKVKNNPVYSSSWIKKFFIWIKENI